MTVVLALRCADGLVLGADSQITDADRGLSYPARKLHRLGDHAAWGGSGARATASALPLLASPPGAALELLLQPALVALSSTSAASAALASSLLFHSSKTELSRIMICLA